MAAPETVHLFITRQRRLLALEREEELDSLSAATSSAASLSQLDAAGSAISRLSFSARRTTTGGRCIVELSTRGGRIISAPRISTGDVVRVCAHHAATSSVSSKSDGGTQKGVQGVLCTLEDMRVEVVLDADAGADGPDFFTDPGERWCVIQVGSDVTVKRCNAALDELELATSSASHHAYALCGVLYRGADARFQDESSLNFTGDQASLLAGLDESQAAAVRHAMLAKDLAVVHGPPGTGKSTTTAVYVGCEVLRGARCLVVAPSNVAADGVAEKLAQLSCRIRFVRAGHPARVLPSVAPHTLEARLAQTDEAALARDVRAEMAVIDVKARKVRGGERRALLAERRVLRKELRVRESQAIKRLLGSVDVVVATVTGAGSSILRHSTADGEYDVVVLDEAGQASEVSALIALLRGRKAVLVGDPFQLAPTIVCSAAAKGGLGQTLLDRVFSCPDLLDSTTKILQIQYRSNKIISDWSSGAFYEGRVKAAPMVAGHLLQHLVNSEASGESSCGVFGDADDTLGVPWILVDTAGCGFGESTDGDVSNGRNVSRSKSNEGEAEIIVQQVQELLNANVPPGAIGIISPYAAQVRLIRSRLRDIVGKRVLIEVATVDSFQGREKEAVLLSLVRSNDRGTIGFLSDPRRLNVAITRAKRLVYIVTDSATTSCDDFISAMIDYASEYGDYRCADPEMTLTGRAAGQEIYVGRSVPSQASVASASPCDEPRRKDRKKKSSKKVKSSSSKSKYANVSTRSQALMDEGQIRDVESAVRSFVETSESGGQESLVFDSSLSSAQRRAVHSLSEQLGISHTTMGEGLSRFITVALPARKKPLHAEEPVMGVNEVSRTGKLAGT